MPMSCRGRASFGPAGPVPASGLTAVRSLQSTYVLRLTGCIFSMPYESEMGIGEMWQRPSPLFSCLGGSAAVAPISSVLDLETARIPDQRAPRRGTDVQQHLG